MKRLGMFLVLCIFCVSACGDEELTSPNDRVLDRAWVAIEPIQCLSNPWERDWLVSHGGDYNSYPKDPTTPGLEPEEFTIIQEYYAQQGVTVFEAATAMRWDVVCMACSCPEGHTMYLSVRGEDVEDMLDLGYREESPE